MRRERFVVNALDEDGALCTLRGVRRLVQYGAFERNSAPVRGQEELFGPDGEDLNEESPGKYVGVLSGKRYTAR